MMLGREGQYSDISGACDHVGALMQPIRLQGCDPFAKGPHLPRGSRHSGSLFDDAVVAELVDAQR